MISLSPLPFARDALAPAMSAATLDAHHGGHYKQYVETLNELIDRTDLADAPLEEIVRNAAETGKEAIFNNAAQVWNHEFFWRSLSATPSEPRGDFAKAIAESFGDKEGLNDAIGAAASAQFGSGWVWLVAADGVLKVKKTSNATTPLVEPGVTPLLTLDVWEHAYYLDYNFERDSYAQTFLKRLANWEFAESNFAAAR